MKMLNNYSFKVKKKKKTENTQTIDKTKVIYFESYAVETHFG